MAASKTVKRILSILPLWLCVLAVCAQAQTMATVSASNLKDAGGNPLNGTIYFKPSIPMRLNGTGQVLQSTVKATVTDGAFSLSLADTTQTSPLNACYVVWAKDANDNLVLGMPPSGANVPAQGYGCVQMSTSWCATHACNFDTFAPTGPALAIIQIGPRGPQGDSGIGFVWTYEVPSGTLNGSNHTFTLSVAPSPSSSLLLTVNGITLAAGQDYALSGSTIIMTTPPATGDIIQTWYETGASIPKVGALFNSASIPTCNSTQSQAIAWVNDGVSTPTYLGLYSAGGSATQLVACDGSNWRYH